MGRQEIRERTTKGRVFPAKSIASEDGRSRRQVQTITCSKCGREGAITDAPWHHMPPEQVQKKFAQQGWDVAKRPADDLCPSCVAAAVAERRACHVKPETSTKENESMTTKPLPPRVTPIQMPSADADSQPVAMSREHRRTIFEYLNEVYLNETVGYAEGNTDKTVAEHLGCPEAWVAQIRKENFGDVKGNEGMVSFLADATKIAERAQAVLTEAAAMHAEIQRRLGDANNLGGKIKVLQVDLERLNEKGRKIAAALGK